MSVLPINDEVQAIGEQYDAPRDSRTGEISYEKVGRLLRRWKQQHVGRIVAPGSEQVL